jgi:hypothetical protein
MNELHLAFQERVNTGTTWTKNKSFEDNGYLVIENLWDAADLVCPIPPIKGQLSYWGKKLDQVNYEPVESQVEGSISRYWHPQYRQIHTEIRQKLEQVLGRKLYNTYYYDRFYSPGQELKKHADRDACEISVTVHIGTNLPKEQANWPIWIKTPDIYTDQTKKEIFVPGKECSVTLKAGDGMIYKGCERPHWRDPMPTPKEKTKLFGKNKNEYYYHQIFFHYVLQDGIRAHCAFDRAK